MKTRPYNSGSQIWEVTGITVRAVLKGWFLNSSVDSIDSECLEVRARNLHLETVLQATVLTEIFTDGESV